ncbi:MAG: OmpA family protein [Ancalomicrobiaceae bacterium]|nr:OmpA family protein [Ancalomicrobiaceae bacterium]
MFAEHDPAIEQDATGENYFISMTDMMVGVLFIFIIMLMAFALDFQKTTTVQENSINVAKDVALKLQRMENNVRDDISTIERADLARRQLLDDLQTQLATEGLDVAIDQANGVLRLTENAVKFDVNRSDLNDKARLNVDKIAHVLDRVLPQYVACKLAGDKPTCAPSVAVGSTVETVFIEGHTDTTGVPDLKERDRRNWELSAERAVATYREIVSQSPLLRSLRNQHGQEIVSVSGYSSTRPIDPHETRDAWERNRRIDLRFVMEVDTEEGLKRILSITNAMKSEIDHLVDVSTVGKRGSRLTPRVPLSVAAPANQPAPAATPGP